MKAVSWDRFSKPMIQKITELAKEEGMFSIPSYG